MKQAVVDWISKEEELTITCDIATISGLVMLTELLVSNKTGVTKLVGFKLMKSKDGEYSAKKLIEILEENLGKFTHNL